MAVTMQRKKNFFEKLAPLWAVLTMGGYVFSVGYFYFAADTFDALNNYNSYLRYIFAALPMLAALLSFVPDGAASIVKHTVYYLVSGGIGLGVLYWYVNNYFTEEENSARALLVLFATNSAEEDYASYYLKYAIFSVLAICGAVAAFCAIKNHLSASGWIKKHIK